MEKLTSIIKLVFAVATPANLTTAKAILKALASFGVLHDDNKQPVTPEVLDGLFDSLTDELVALRDKAAASNARLEGR
jgi:hypothetical protein